MERVLTIDRGNASIKGAIFEEGRILSRFSGGEAADVLSWAGDFGPDGAALSSVIGGWVGECRGLLRSAGIDKVAEASCDSDWPFGLGLDEPASVGADRLCAAAGAASRGASDAVIIDAGTAVTVDILRAGTFEGGSIMPGYRMMLVALGEGASALPLLDADGDLPPPPGRSTAAAMLAGVGGAFRGGVSDLLRHSRELFEGPVEVFLTGGDAGLLENVISPAPRLAPDLVLEGLNLLYFKEFG